MTSNDKLTGDRQQIVGTLCMKAAYVEEFSDAETLLEMAEKHFGSDVEGFQALVGLAIERYKAHLSVANKMDSVDAEQSQIIKLYRAAMGSPDAGFEHPGGRASVGNPAARGPQGQSCDA